MLKLLLQPLVILPMCSEEKRTEDEQLCITVHTIICSIITPRQSYKRFNSHRCVLPYITKQTEKKPATPSPNPDTGLEVKKMFSSVFYVPCLSEEFRRIFQDISVQVIFKKANTLKSILMHPEDKMPAQLKQNIVYKWSCQEENCNLS